MHNLLSKKGVFVQKVKPEKKPGIESRLQRLETEIKLASLEVSQLKSEVDKMKLVICDYDSMSEVPLEKPKKVSKIKAAKMVKEYVVKNPGCKTSDIIFDLKLHPDVVLPIFRSLREEGELRSEEIGC